MPHPPGSPHWQRDRSHNPVLNYHLNMLLDEARMDSYRRAIAATVKPGDVVLDIGCGTGVLSFMACEAGAKKVYAIEGGPIIETARELAIDNGFADRIEFLDGWSTKLDLPEPANMLITETIGSAGLDEGIIAWICDANSVCFILVRCSCHSDFDCGSPPPRPSRTMPSPPTGGPRSAIQLRGCPSPS